MCNRALNWAYEQKLPTIEKFVLVTIANMINSKTNLCWPSQDTLATRCAICRQRLNKALANLRRMGLVLVEKSARACRYRLPPLPAAPVVQDDISAASVAIDDTSSVAHDDTSAAPVAINDSDLSPLTTSPVAVDDTEPVKNPKREPEGPPPIVPPPPAGRGKKTKREFPADWQPDDEDFIFALNRGYSPEWIAEQGDSCRDHHSPRKNAFADFHAVWRNWVRTAQKFETQRKASANGRQNPHDAETAAFELVSRGFAI